MKKLMKKGCSLFLVLALLICAALPAGAVNENNEEGVIFTATLDKNTISKSSNDQTVLVSLKTNKPITMDGFGATVTMASPLTLASVAGSDSKIVFSASDYNLANGKIGWSTADVENISNVTELMTATVTIPANTPAGQYQVGFTSLELTKDYGEIWEDAASALATLTITDGTASNYSAALTCGASTVTVGDSISVNVGVSHASKTNFAAAELVLTYDSSKLSFNETASTLCGATVKAENGTLKLEHYGENKNCGTGVYVLSFEAVGEGSASVSLSSAAFSDRVSAAHADLNAADISNADISVTVNKQSHTVTLPDIFTGNTTVTDGESYTFSVKDAANFTYSAITATVDGTSVAVTDNGNGTYTVASVTGTLVITGTRTAKSYSVIFSGNAASEVTGAATATYGQNYTFTISAASGWSYSVSSITVGGVAYTGYSVTENQYTIPGTDINGNIIVTVNKSQTTASVTVQGSGAGAAAGYAASADIGSPYTLTITPEAGYYYTVSATMGGASVGVTQNGNQYTLSKVTGNVVFTVERSVNVDGVSVQKFLALDGSNMWLVTNTAELSSGSVSTYDGTKMFWSAKYSAYCYLVVAPTLSAEEAAAKIGIAAAEKTFVDYGMDVNCSGIVDVNDSQLIYNMYNVDYAGFTAQVTMEKFLRADINGDAKVDVSDAAGIVAFVLGQ